MINWVAGAVVVGIEPEVSLSQWMRAKIDVSYVDEPRVMVISRAVGSMFTYLKLICR